MLSNPSKDIGKKELDIYLRELGKEYRKLAGEKESGRNRADWWRSHISEL